MAPKHHHTKKPKRAATRRPSGALQRSLAALTIGVVQGRQARDESLAYTKLGEMFQQIQVPINGNVGNKITYGTADVTWPYPFVYAPGQRDSSLQQPHASSMLEIVSGRQFIILPTIQGWKFDSVNGYYTGLTLGIQAWLPGARKKKRFYAILHLTVSGYGAPSEDDNETDPSTLPPLSDQGDFVT